MTKDPLKIYAARKGEIKKTTGFCRLIGTMAELGLPNAWLRSVASGNHFLLNRLYTAQTQHICKLNAKRLHMKRQKTNCSGNRSKERTIGKNKHF